MTEKTAWADLPNAKYIDLVMDSLKKNPAARGAEWGAACGAARDAARDMARDAAWSAERSAVWEAAWDAAREAASAVEKSASKSAVWAAASTAAWGALLALITWDDCGHLLEENPENVKMLALLGNHAAVLLYHACLALQSIKELEMA
jgi:hypothetical protein